MTEINDHIIEYLDYYCELSSPPKFAVLIKGEWGSGKTWLVEKYIKEKYKQNETYSLGNSPQSSANCSEKNPKPIYISLYGVASLSEIDDLIFSQLHPILSSKALKLGSKFLVGAVKATIKVDLNVIVQRKCNSY